MESSVLILCLGNPLRGDDAFGLLVYRLLRRLRLPAVYAGSILENATRILRRANPKSIIIVDALVGAYDDLVVSRLSDEMELLLLSSHNLPLKLLFECIGFDPKKVIVVGASARNLSLGSRPSERVRELAVEAASLVAQLVRQIALPSELELGNKSSFLARNVENATPS